MVAAVIAIFASGSAGSAARVELDELLLERDRRREHVGALRPRARPAAGRRCRGRPAPPARAAYPGPTAASSVAIARAWSSSCERSDGQERVGVQHRGRRRAPPPPRAATGRAGARPRRTSARARADAPQRPPGRARRRRAGVPSRRFTAGWPGNAVGSGGRRAARAARTRPRRRSRSASANSSRDSRLLRAAPTAATWARSAARSAASAASSVRRRRRRRLAAPRRASASSAPRSAPLGVRARRASRGVVVQRRDAPSPSTRSCSPSTSWAHDLRLVRRPAAGEQQRAGAEQRAARHDPRSDGRTATRPGGEWRRLPTTRPWCPGSRALRRAWCTGPRIGTSSRRRRR